MLSSSFLFKHVTKKGLHFFFYKNILNVFVKLNLDLISLKLNILYVLINECVFFLEWPFMYLITGVVLLLLLLQ